MSLIHSFDPVWRSDAVILVLGTMPSVKSLEKEFYYAHPRNAFWRIMSETLGVARPASVEDKKGMLTEHGIALWDAARSCVREGSLDSNIKNVEPNDIGFLLSQCPSIRRMLFNGQKARELYEMFNDTVKGIEYITLPSTSPAYTLSFDKKLEAWRKAITLEDYNERY